MTPLPNNARVKWIHDCPLDHPCGFDRGGSVWRPHPSVARGRDDWQTANKLNITADPQPDADRLYVMVAWDCRRGTLQMHYVDELEAL